MSATNVYHYDESAIEAFVLEYGERLLKANFHSDTTEVAAPELVMLKPGRKIPPAPKPPRAAKRTDIRPDDTPIREAGITVAMDDHGNVTRKVKRTAADTIKANSEMMAALELEKQREAELNDFMRKETLSLRERKAAEAKRIAAVQADKAKSAKAKISVSVMTTNGRQHTVRRIMTTSDRLAKERRLPDDLKACVDAFAPLVGDTVGASTRDGDDATSRLTISYDGYSGTPMFGSASNRRLPPAWIAEGLPEPQGVQD